MLKWFNQVEFLVICYVIYPEKVIKDLAIPLARDNLPGLVRNLTSKTVNKFERKMSGKGAIRAGI